MLKKLTNFIIKYNKYFDEDKITEYLERHSNYGTLLYAINEDSEIIAMVRWNIKKWGYVADVLDMAVRKDFRNKNIGKDFINRAVERFPRLKYLRFKRGVRGDDRIRIIKIDKVLKRNIF